MSCSLRPTAGQDGVLWGEEFSRAEIDDAKARGGLLSLELELSRRCNLACIYCYAASGQPLKDELTLEEIDNIIFQAKQLGAKKIIVLGGGEPLLYQNILHVLDKIVQNDLDCDIFTNGTLITPELATFLYDRKIGVAIKLNSFNSKIQDELAGVDGAYDKIQAGLQHLLQAGYPDDAHRLGIETIICQQNYDEIPAIWRWARQNDIIPYIEIMTQQGRAKDHPELTVTSLELKNLFNLLSNIDRTEFGIDWVPHPPLAASQCARHEYSCTVTANGDVHPCPGVDIAVGNIREADLKEILHKSPVIQELRNIRKLIKGRCKTCDLSQQCYGCRGHAYQTTGDYLESDPICWLEEDEVDSI